MKNDGIVQDMITLYTFQISPLRIRFPHGGWRRRSHADEEGLLFILGWLHHADRRGDGVVQRGVERTLQHRILNQWRKLKRQKRNRS